MGRGPASGVDLRLHRNGELVFVQCRYWKSENVGVKVMCELFGIMSAQGAKEGIIVTSGNFTEDAKKFARGKSIDLIAGNQLVKLISKV